MATRKTLQNIFAVRWPGLSASAAPKIVVAAIVILSLAPQSVCAQSREPLGKLIDLVQRKGDRRPLYNVVCEGLGVPLRNGQCAVRQYALQEDPAEPHPGRIHAFDVISPQQVLLVVHDERVGTLFLVGPNGTVMNVASEIINSGKPPSLTPLARTQWNQMTPKLNEEIAYWLGQESTIAKDKDVP